MLTYPKLCNEWAEAAHNRHVVVDGNSYQCFTVKIFNDVSAVRRFTDILLCIWGFKVNVVFADAENCFPKNTSLQT